MEVKGFEKHMNSDRMNSIKVLEKVYKIYLEKRKKNIRHRF